MKVIFVVTELVDIRKSESSLEVGKEYTGTLRETNNSVWWTDPMNNQDWVFWIDDTCKVVKYLN